MRGARSPSAKARFVLKRLWVIVALLALVFLGCLIYGIYLGDADYVLENAKSFCFT